MNADLFTDDIKKSSGIESFWLIGQPDTDIKTITKGEDKARLKHMLDAALDARKFLGETTISDQLEKKKLTLTKVHIKLISKGVDVSYSALWRLARQRLGFGGAEITVRMADTKPGEVAEVDFGRFGIICSIN